MKRSAWLLVALKRFILATGILLVVGVTAALSISRTASGRGLALEWGLGKLRPAINGTIHVGSVGPGGILGGATLVDVALSDSLGRPVLVADSLRARYSLAELVVGAPAIAELQIWGPVVNLEPAPGERVDLAGLLTRRDSVEPGTAAPAPGPLVDPPADPPTDPPADPPADPAADPALVVRSAAIHGGTVTLRDGAGRETSVERIDVALARVDVRPGGERFLTAEVERADLSFPVTAGRLELAAIRGVLEAGDEGITLDADRFRLPGSVGNGSLSYGGDGGGAGGVAGGGTGGGVGGAVRRGYVLDLEFQELALADLPWVAQRFDRETARGGARIGIDADGVRIDVDAGVVEAESGRVAIDGGYPWAIPFASVICGWRPRR